VAGPATANESLSAPLGDDEAAEHARAAQAIAAQLGRVVLGQEAAIREALAALLARGHVLLEGVPGTAKTLLVRALGLALGLEFRRIQFTPDLMPSDITGVNLLGGDGRFVFRPGPLFGDLVLGDEINRAPAKTQAALLEAMQERRVTVDGVSHQLPTSFTVFATQNPVEFEGTYPLPEAELDRFLIKVVLDYPAEAVERGILQRVLEGFEADDPASYGVATSLDGAGLAVLRAAVRRVRVEPSLVAYVTAIVRATRDAPTLTMGASPRASVALLKVAQAAALLDGRAFVVPDDVKQFATAVLRHRVSVAPELDLEGVTADVALQAILDKVDAPK
jgi:MoxR-like ATPase